MLDLASRAGSVSAGPPPANLPAVDAARLRATLEALGEIGATPAGGVTRLALTDEDRAARELLVRWMEDAGLRVRYDDAGNLYGRRPGSEDGAAPVVIGSHLDTVVRGGRFDGTYGVAAALEVVRTLNDRGIVTRHPVEVVSFSAEEGSRFTPALLGSGLAAGVFSPEFVHSRTDPEGRRFGDELARIGFLGRAGDRLGPVRAYVEPHIEQGPVLEAEGVPIGVVEGIVCDVWLRGRVTGEAAHAGPTPMTRRRDAGLAAARVALGVREIAWLLGSGTVATVGQMHWEPGGINVIPGEARFSVDLRHPCEEEVDRAITLLHNLCRRIEAQEGVTVELEEIWRLQPLQFDAEVLAALEASAGERGYPHRRLTSGAGHDARYIARLGPAGMLFIPCRGGRSHTESEEASWDDVTRGANVLLGAVLRLAGVAPGSRPGTGCQGHAATAPPPPGTAG